MPSMEQAFKDKSTRPKIKYFNNKYSPAAVKPHDSLPGQAAGCQPCTNLPICLAGLDSLYMVCANNVYDVPAMMCPPYFTSIPNMARTGSGYTVDFCLAVQPWRDPCKRNY